MKKKDQKRQKQTIINMNKHIKDGQNPSTKGVNYGALEL